MHSMSQLERDNVMEVSWSFGKPKVGVLTLTLPAPGIDAVAKVVCPGWQLPPISCWWSSRVQVPSTAGGDGGEILY